MPSVLEIHTASQKMQALLEGYVAFTAKPAQGKQQSPKHYL